MQREVRVGSRFSAGLAVAMVVATSAWAPSCAYVTEEEARLAWDSDSDGWPDDDDCRPDDGDYHKYAYDLRGDGCDHDCGTEPDADGDDWPDAADCDPQDPEKFPCSPFEGTQDGGADYDCDGLDGVRDDDCPGLDPDFPEVQLGDPEIPTCDVPPEGV
jgi:hypothetical protein